MVTGTGATGPGRLVWRHLASDWLRTLLTGLVLFVCTVFLTGAATVVQVLDAAATAPAAMATLFVQSQRGFARALPATHVDVVRALPDVVEVRGLRARYATARDLRAAFVIHFVGRDGAGLLLDTFSSAAAPEALAAFERTPDGALVGALAAGANGWRAGDVVRVTLLGADVLPLRIVGTIEDGLLARNVVAHLDYLWRRRGTAEMNFVLVRTRPGAENAVAAAIDARLRSSGAPTRTGTGGAMIQRFQDANSVRPLVLAGIVVVLLATGLIAGSNVALVLRERARLVPILKALGFDRRWIGAVLLAEPLLLAAGSAALGLGVFALVARHGLVVDLGVASLFRPTLASYLAGLGTAVAIALAGAAVPLRGTLATPASVAIARWSRS